MEKPKASSEAIRKTMKSNKGTNTKPELEFRKRLWESGIRGYRINYKKLPGSPDICFTRWKLAIFINGCFWHRCPYCKPNLPKKNASFWKQKFSDNIERDKRVRNELEYAGWKVLTVWECKAKKDLTNQVQRVIDELEHIKASKGSGT